jgi:hypothetical protein
MCEFFYLLILQYFTQGAGHARQEKFDAMNGLSLAAIARREGSPAVAMILDYNGSLLTTLLR